MVETIIRHQISPVKNSDKIQSFVLKQQNGRTRVAFDIALTVHRKIQERDIELGRSVGNSILRWLDHMKPSAEIRLPADNLPRRVANSMEAARGKGPVSTKPAPRDPTAACLLHHGTWHLAPFPPSL
ncbi:unnamed protein product [Spirodela intermedia]|uniref:Uncharacterized protein n=1 Tax=Spirodela intermedia TaxID=51605 RepID=A0ABN7EDB6_SPIIN|nr:unnamed protein product [Spirodela intermedia]